jgi:hypothetical protein
MERKLLKGLYRVCRGDGKAQITKKTLVMVIRGDDRVLVRGDILRDTLKVLGDDVSIAFGQDVFSDREAPFVSIFGGGITSRIAQIRYASHDWFEWKIA